MARRKRTRYDHINVAVLTSPIGPLTACVAHGIGTPALCAILFGAYQGNEPPCIRLMFKLATGIGPSDRDPLLARTQMELDEYFAGERKRFTLPLAVKGTPFQEEVWRALIDIPYGQTTSYGELASKIGRPDAARAVGMANHANRIPIVVPCHRVLAAGGKIGGYGGGVEVKQRLLEVEQGTPLLASRATSNGQHAPQLRLVR